MVCPGRLRHRICSTLAAATLVVLHGAATAATAPGPRLPTGFVGYPGDSAMKFGVDLSMWALATDARTSGVYVAYGQRSLWDLDDDARPFRVENDFRPEAGVAFGPDLASGLLDAWPDGLVLSAAFVHESNGLENADSRGWNRIVGGLHFGREDDAVRASILGWHAFRVEDTNADITRDAGDGEVRIVADLPKFLGGSSLRVRSAFSPDARSGVFFSNLEAGIYVEPDFLPRWILPRDVAPLVDLVVEWFVGTGEFLYDSAAHTNRIGIGVAVHPWGARPDATDAASSVPSTSPR